MRIRSVELPAGSGAGKRGDEPGGLQATRASVIMGAHARIGCAGSRSPLRRGQAAGKAEERGCAKQVLTLLVEPNGLLREGVRRILTGSAYSPVLSVASLDDARSLLGAQREALLLIMNAGEEHGETCRQVRALLAQNPSARIVMFVDRCDLQQMLIAFDAGAAACLDTSTSHEALLKMLDLVMLGETLVPAMVLTALRRPGLPHDLDRRKELSSRERAVLECLTEGASNKVIARRLEITEATVKVHVKSILRKVRAKNRTQAALWASMHIQAQRS